MMRSVIVGTGSSIPQKVVSNSQFETSEFYEADRSKSYKSNKLVIEKFSDITGIYERRYVSDGQNCSDLAVFSAEAALASSKIDRESLDYIIVAHNFGDVSYRSNRTDQVPSLASRVKARLGIRNSACVAYDILFGCPGWIEGMLQADGYIRSGRARRCMIIGAETLSRVIDPHDRDSMIFSDGGGAIILEATDDEDKGVLASQTRTYAVDHLQSLHMAPSNSGFTDDPEDRFLKMNGRKVYEFALTHVPLVVKEAIDRARLHLQDIKKVLLHQANDKMDRAILERLYKLYNEKTIPHNVMPMTIQWLGNSSVATVPTLLDLLLKGKLEGHAVHAGDHVVLASVGAGMNINAVVYRF